MTQQSKTEKAIEITATTCGPSTAKCKCDCPRSCEHKWYGPEQDLGNGAWSVTCSRCGMDAMSHSLWVCP